MIGGSSFSTNCPTPCIAISILGIIFSPNALTESTKLLIKVSKSALLSAIPVKTLVHADLVIFKLPSIVEDASFAVVPVISISVWIAWIASIMSLKLLISYLIPLILLASSRSLCISSFVPP